MATNVLVSPSSILPELIGDVTKFFFNPADLTWEGYTLTLGMGGGYVDGNFKDYRQHRDFNDAFLVDAAGNPIAEQLLGRMIPGFLGKGINKRYTSVKDYFYGNMPNGELYGQSGIFITYPPSTGNISGITHPSMTGYTGSTGSGIFNPANLISEWSNAKKSKDRTGAAGIDDFTIFNDYIHYESSEAVLEDTISGGNVNPGGQQSDPDEDISIRIPFVADVIPTENIWDRYGGHPQDSVNEGSDPNYSD